MKPFFIVITGPTGVGKTDFINKLESILSIPIAIINGDMGQMYTQLSIGTAKPDWKSHNVPHYLFDIIDKPISYTIAQYNKEVNDCIVQCWKENRLPIIVGGSGFYLKALFYPPVESDTYKSCLSSGRFNDENFGSNIGNVSLFENLDVEQKKIIISLFKNKNNNFENQKLWEILNNIDPQRAQEIDPNDKYRIERALELWYKTGKLPSSFKPIYNPPAPYMVYFLIRDINDLYNRINDRVLAMLNSGWIEEVENLSQEWKKFLQEKKLIGYEQIIDFIKKDCNIPKDQLVSNISTKTRNYAKRQITFWKSFSKDLKSNNICEINLTNTDLEAYTIEMVKKIKNIYDNKII